MIATSTPTTPAAAAAREQAQQIGASLAYDPVCLDLRDPEAEKAFMDYITQALLSARQAQLEDDCKAGCYGCSDGHAVEFSEGELWHYYTDKVHGRVWVMTCNAAAIRAQAAAKESE